MTLKGDLKASSIDELADRYGETLPGSGDNLRIQGEFLKRQTYAIQRQSKYAVVASVLQVFAVFAMYLTVLFVAKDAETSKVILMKNKFPGSTVEYTVRIDKETGRRCYYLDTLVAKKVIEAAENEGFMLISKCN